MPSRHLLDPELAPLLEIMGQVDVTQSGQISAVTKMLMEAPAPTSERVESSEVRIPGPPGAPEIRCLLYRSKEISGPAPAVLHIHGGGYVMGAPEMSAANNLKVAEDFQAVVLSVDYRLAPATKAPGAVEDCYAGLRWLFGNAERLGVDTARIGVAGESAGGGLAAALALLARDRGEFPLAFQHLIFPMLDDRTTVDADPSPYVGQFVWTRERNRHGWGALLEQAPGSEGVSPYAAAARAEDVAGLPPTYIATGALDLFVEENLEYARRLIRSGVPTELHVYPGAPHAFQVVPDAAVARQATRDSLTAMGKALGRR